MSFPISVATIDIKQFWHLNLSYLQRKITYYVQLLSKSVTQRVAALRWMRGVGEWKEGSTSSSSIIVILVIQARDDEGRKDGEH